MPLEIVAPEQKINMSLDDLIKLKNNPEKKKGKKVTAKPSPAANARKAAKKGNNNQTVKANKPVNTKVAASVGASKAKRAATVAQKRGLNATGKATKEEIKKEIKKETKKAAAAAVATGGLKISFKPSELNKTTERDVAQQIKAVLSRQSGSSNPGSSKSIASHSSSETSKPRNPKTQGKNAVLRLKR